MRLSSKWPENILRIKMTNLKSPIGKAIKRVTKVVTNYLYFSYYIIPKGF